jgi:HEPN domain-containing protein
MLEYGNYFFADIKKEGIVLFDSGRYKLSDAVDLSPKEQQAKMTENFKQWVDSGNEFLIDYKNAFERSSLFNAAFLLHQTAERYYTAILLTFTDYRPKEHDLASLNAKAIAADERFSEAFPLNTQEEKDRFRLLVRAYVDARYRMNQYHITATDLAYLGKRVFVLKGLCEKICREEIRKVTNNV